MLDGAEVNFHHSAHNRIAKLGQQITPVARLGDPSQRFGKIVLGGGVLDAGDELTSGTLPTFREKWVVALIFSSPNYAHSE
jgi:hypothetical protein